VFYTPSLEPDGSGEEDGQLEQRLAYPPATTLPDPCGGKETKELWEKLLPQVGCDTWKTAMHKSNGATALADNHHIDVFAFTTDKGPDQQGSNKRIGDEVKDFLFIWIVVQFCIMHQIQLICEKQLKRLAKYWSTLSKMVNVWRAPHNVTRIRKAWEYFGLDRAAQVCRGMPPRPLKGRWAYLTKTEKFFLRATHRETAHVFKKVFDPEESPQAKAKAEQKMRAAAAKAQKEKAKAKTKTKKVAVIKGNTVKAKASARHVDDDLEEPYKQKLGRWIKDALEGAQSDDLWVSMHIAHTSRSPVTHLFYWYQQQGSRLARTQEWQAESKSLSMELVYSKADEIAIQFDKLFTQEAMVDSERWGPVWAYAHDRESKEKLTGRIVMFTMECCADFERRIRGQTKRFPLQMLWMVYKPPEVKCPKRAAVANEMLKQRAESRSVEDGITWKVVALFPEELQHAEKTGKLDANLYKLLLAISKLLMSDTQEIEGMNSVIKRVLEIAPAIGLRLVCARLMIKKWLASLAKTTEQRERVISKCADCHKESLNIYKTEKWVKEHGNNMEEKVRRLARYRVTGRPHTR